MDRRRLETAGAEYPYLQGLWTIPLGIGMIVAGLSNLQDRPTGIGAIVLILGGLGLAGGASLVIGRYYRDRYGSVTPTRDRTIRQVVALVAWIVVLFLGANEALFWSPDGPQCRYPSSAVPFLASRPGVRDAAASFSEGRLTDEARARISELILSGRREEAMSLYAEATGASDSEAQAIIRTWDTSQNY